MTQQDFAGTDEHAASAALKERVALSSTAASAGITIAALGSCSRAGRYSRHDHDVSGDSNRKQACG